MDPAFVTASPFADMFEPLCCAAYMRRILRRVRVVARRSWLITVQKIFYKRHQKAFNRVEFGLA